MVYIDKIENLCYISNEGLKGFLNSQKEIVLVPVAYYLTGNNKLNAGGMRLWQKY